MAPVTLTPTERAVEPGGSASFALDAPGAARVDLRGPAAEWAVVTGSRVVVAVPRSARVAPGRRALVVRAVGPAGEVVEAAATVDILPFADLQASVSPRASRGRRMGRHVLHLENCGNRPVTAAVETDGDEAVRIELDRVSVALAPGEAAAVPVRVEARSPRLFGRPRSRSFRLAVREGPAQPAVTAEGFLVQERQRWPLPVALTVLLVGAVAALARPGDDGGSQVVAPAVPTSAAAGGAVPAQTATCPPTPADPSGGLLVQNFLFCPGTVTVRPGTELQWTNRDVAPHTVSADNQSFDTGNFDRGEQRTVRFDQPGTFPYFCRVHPFMRGTVVVA